MRQPLYMRLRPFLRRDLRARLVSALLTVAVLTGLTWLGVSALAGIDSREAHDLRVQLGLESPTQVCGHSPYLSECNYDDRVQEKVDREHAHLRSVRLALLTDLDRRIDMALGRLDEADRVLAEMVIDPAGQLSGDVVALRAALGDAVIDVTPAHAEPIETRQIELLSTFQRLDVAATQSPAEEAPPTTAPTTPRGMTALVNGRQVPVHVDPSEAPLAQDPRWVDDLGQQRRFQVDPVEARGSEARSELLAAIDGERDALTSIQGRVQRLLHRDQAAARTEPAAQTSRRELVAALTRRGNEDYEEHAKRLDFAGWLTGQAPGIWLRADQGFDWDHSPPAIVVAAGLPEVDLALARMAEQDLDVLYEAISDSNAEIWAGGWNDSRAARTAVQKPMIRYRSPVTPTQEWRLFGVLAFMLAGIMLVVVGPVVTATSTAREREAGTLPVLRMTGLSAGDLALAMAIGPNVFALVTGGGLLLLAIPVLALTAGPGALVLPLLVLLALAAATHLTAIGLGDALGQRVNAMVVGGLLGLAILGPGLVGSVMTVGNMAATGMLLGPLPGVMAEAVHMSGLPFANLVEHHGFGGNMGTTMLGYAVVVQTLLGGLCLLSWRRRVEQAWAPLFRPIEGAVLALVSVGCSALAVFDLSERIHVQTYDTVNLITFVSTAFLMPVLAWLLVSSLVRPARASAVASCSEVRRAFGRFQLFVVLTAAALAGAYLLVLENTHLRTEKSEVMWATLTQALLVAETAVATLLLASRRREGKHRVFILGTAVALLQLVFAIGVYNLEVEHVAYTQAPSMPFMLGMEASPYWVAFLVVLWGAGLALVLAALLRERGHDHPASVAAPEEDADDKGSRWLH